MKIIFKNTRNFVYLGSRLGSQGLMLGSRVKVRVDGRVNVRCVISASALQENILCKQLHEFDSVSS